METCSPRAALPRAASRRSWTQKEKTIYTSERYQSFIGRFDVPRHGIVPGERPFLSTGLGCQLLGAAGCWGPWGEGGRGGRSTLEDIIFVASAKWSVLQAALFCPFSAGRRAHCGVGPLRRDDWTATASRGAKTLFIRVPHPPPPTHRTPSLNSRCLHAMVLFLCICASFHFVRTLTHTHTLVSVLMPVSHPSRAGSSCPHIYPLPLCCPARRGDVTDSNKVPFGSICHRGADLPLRIMRPWWDLTATPAEPLIIVELKVPDQCAAVRDTSGPPLQLLYFSGSFVFDHFCAGLFVFKCWCSHGSLKCKMMGRHTRWFNNQMSLCGKFSGKNTKT